jgi:hypothetical protein
MLIKNKNMKTDKIYIFFNYEQFKEKENKLKNCVVISQFQYPSNDNFLYIDVNNILTDNSRLIKEVKYYFDKNQNNINDFYGFINNFYDCSLIPIKKYMAAIQYAKEKFSINLIVFPNKISPLVKSVNYFMAEHESQGRRLYDREAVFYYTLLNYCKLKKMTVHHDSKRITTQSYFSNWARVVLVSVVRFFKSLIQSSFLLNKRRVNFKPDYIYIVRTKTQLDFIDNIVSNSCYKHLIIIGSAFFDSGLMESSRRIKGKNIYTMDISSPLFVDVVIEYMRMFFRVFKVKNFTISVEGMPIFVKQALIEIFAMQPDISLYRKKLSTTLSRINAIDNCILFTTEQKSPHAYIDSEVGKTYCKHTVQLMSVDQENVNIPNPIPSDVFCVDVKPRVSLLEEAWSESRLFYYYPIKGLNKEIKVEKIKNSVCFFMDCEDINVNSQVIECLSNFASKHIEFNIFLKPHPRDLYNYKITDLYNLNLLSNNLAFKELFSLFDIALSGTSAVVLDILIGNKPLIYLDLFEEQKKFNFIFMTKWYKPKVQRYQEIEYWLTHKSELIRDFRELQKEIIGSNRVCKSDEFLDKLSNYLN